MVVLTTTRPIRVGLSNFSLRLAGSWFYRTTSSNNHLTLPETQRISLKNMITLMSHLISFLIVRVVVMLVTTKWPVWKKSFDTRLRPNHQRFVDFFQTYPAPKMKDVPLKRGSFEKARTVFQSSFFQRRLLVVFGNKVFFIKKRHNITVGGNKIGAKQDQAIEQVVRHSGWKLTVADQGFVKIIELKPFTKKYSLKITVQWNMFL